MLKIGILMYVRVPGLRRGHLATLPPCIEPNVAHTDRRLIPCRNSIPGCNLRHASACATSHGSLTSSHMLTSSNDATLSVTTSTSVVSRAPQDLGVLDWVARLVRQRRFRRCLATLGLLSFMKLFQTHVSTHMNVHPRHLPLPGLHPRRIGAVSIQAS